MGVIFHEVVFLDYGDWQNGSHVVWKLNTSAVIILNS